MAELYSDEYFMEAALNEAEQARAKDEVPVGAVIVSGNRIIARAHNLTETLKDPTAHAEMQAITSATSWLGGKYLEGCTIYVTLEPCNMCAGAILWARPERLVYGASDEKRGYTLTGKEMIHPKTTVSAGVLEKECGKILSDFFRKKRR
jgi:tRNA(adenine34) deaminase